MGDLGDITLCVGAACPLKMFCLRSTTEVLGRQSFFGSLPFNFTEKKCEYFLPNHRYKAAVEQEAYKIWEANGRTANTEWKNWLEAENALNQFLIQNTKIILSSEQS